MLLRFKSLAVASGISLLGILPLLAAEGPFELFAALCLDTKGDPAIIAESLLDYPAWASAPDPSAVVADSGFDDQKIWLIAGTPAFGSLATGAMGDPDHMAVPGCILTIPRASFTASDFEASLRSAVGPGGDVPSQSDGQSTWFAIPWRGNLVSIREVRFEGPFVQFTMMDWPDPFLKDVFGISD